MKHSLSYNRYYLVCTALYFLTCTVSFNHGEYEPNRIVAWVKENFKQAEKHEHTYVKRCKEFIRNLKVYNNLSVIATFDVMFLTDQARMLYVDYHAKIHGLTFDEIQTLYNRQINENKYFISAYVIAWHDEYVYVDSKALFTGEYQKNNNVLKGDDPLWNVSLLLGGRKYIPETIKVVEMPVEYQRFFGPCCNQFATTYLVRFAAKDKFNNYIFSDQKSSPVMRFSSPVYKVDAIWKNIYFYTPKN